jgi:hypothetical protein
MSVKDLKSIIKTYELFLPDAIVALKNIEFINFGQIDGPEMDHLIRYCHGPLDVDTFLCISFWEGAGKNWTVNMIKKSELEIAAADMAEAKGRDAYNVILINSDGVTFDLKAEVKQITYKLEKR